MARVPLAILAIGCPARCRVRRRSCSGRLAVLPQGPAPIAQLIGPWQPRPFVLDPALRSRVEQACRRDMERGPENVAALVDVRGGAVAVVRMVGQGAGMCDALEITAGGQINGAGGGWYGRRRRATGTNRSDRAGGCPSRVGRRRQPQGPGMVGDRTRGTGHCVGRDRARRVAPAVLATLENGWFAGWWPANVPPNGLGGAGPGAGGRGTRLRRGRHAAREVRP